MTTTFSRSNAGESRMGSIARTHLWSIVLAGGDGVRTRDYVRRRFGQERPKQYCTFLGERSLFQQTIDRAASRTPFDRIVIVAAQHHQRDVWEQLEGRPVGMVLFQPRNMDTAAGVFLPLTFILARDPKAKVVVYPSDHFIHPEEPFVWAVDQAVWGSTMLVDRPVLLAAEPDSLELDYGWIKPGRFLAWTGQTSVRAVEAFVEKPDEPWARQATVDGSLWNTMVVAAKAKHLWTLGWNCFPGMMERFERLKQAIDTVDELKVLKEIYETMPRWNFSSHLLERVPERLAVIKMPDVLWSDWGNPTRIIESIHKVSEPSVPGKEPLPFIHQG